MIRLRQLTLLLLCSALLSTGIGFAAAKLSEPSTATAARTNAEVRELQQLNSTLREANNTLSEIDRAIGNPAGVNDKSALQLLQAINTGIGGRYLGDAATKLLYEIKQNTGGP